MWLKNKKKIKVEAHLFAVSPLRSKLRGGSVEWVEGITGWISIFSPLFLHLCLFYIHIFLFHVYAILLTNGMGDKDPKHMLLPS